MRELSKGIKVKSLVFKLIIIVSAVVGVVLSAIGGRDEFMGGSTVFMYFTIQSNILIAIICAIGLTRLNKPAHSLWFIIKYVGTVAITLTGVVFCFVLAPTMGAAAWNVQNILTHVIVPVLSVVDFFTTGVISDIKKRNVLWVTVPPIIYAIYAGVGYAKNWQFAAGYNYPYFFLNWGSEAGAFGFSKELPYLGCAWWILILLCFLLVVGYVYLAVLDKIKKRKVA